MKKTIKNLAFFALLIFFLPSCDEVLDINEDPSKVSNPTLDVLLPEIEFRTARVHFGQSYTACQVAHQMDNYTGYYTSVNLSNVWFNIYTKVLNNAQVMIDQAEANGSSDYVGIGKLLQAHSLGILTDTWEDVPYTEALKGSENIKPIYDKQEAVYNNVLRLIDEGIAALEAGDSFLKAGSDDMIYGGDVDKWIKFGHSLKARYLLHLSNKTVNWDEVQNEAKLGILENADNFALSYEEGIPNPWYTRVAIAIQTGNLSLAPSRFLVNKMNGLHGMPLDPRLSAMMERSATSDTTDYFGLAEWDDTPLQNSDLTSNTWYGQKETPMLMFTAAETHFIMAEAALHTGNMLAESFENGIKAHMSMLGVEPGTYVADVNDGDIGIDDIMTQKFIALYLNGEVWTDMRRHQFDPNIFLGFVVPDDSEGRLGGPAQRSLYPASETTRNGKNVPVVEILKKMWRD